MTNNSANKFSQILVAFSLHILLKNSIFMYRRKVALEKAIVKMVS